MFDCVISKEEGCTYWSELRKEEFITDDLDGRIPYKEGNFLDLQRTKYFEIFGNGNEISLKIIDDDDSIVWSKALVENVLKFPEPFLNKTIDENGIERIRVLPNPDIDKIL